MAYHHHHDRVILAAILIAIGAGPAAAATSVNLTITGDDAYAVYLASDPGNPTGVIINYVGDHTAYTVPDVLTPKTYNNLIPPDNGYIFIAAWSDYSGVQGLLVDATLSTGQTYLSGDSHWEVASLSDGAPGNLLTNKGDPALDPRYIASFSDFFYAFGSWTTPTLSPLTNAQGGIEGTVAGINPLSRWMWYDGGYDTSREPFVGFDHGEPLLFRLAIPASAPVTNLYYNSFTGGFWNSPSSWLPGVTPTSATDVTFARLDTYTVNLSSAASTHNFTVEAVDHVTVHMGGNTLAIGGDLVVHPASAGNIGAGSLTLLGNGQLVTFASVAGNVVNYGTIQITDATLTVAGNVTNYGSILHHNATFVVNGTYIVHGTVASDPSTLDLGNLIIESDGSITGSAGDLYIIHGDLTDHSLPGHFNTAEVDLLFAGSGPHTLSTDNDLSFHHLTLDAGGTLILSGTGSLSLQELLLPDTNPAHFASEILSSLDITYDANDPANSYLLGNSYALPGGGSLSPQGVPEPATLSIAGLACTVLLRRRRYR